MQTPKILSRMHEYSQIIRYLINGLFATVIHFLFLSFILQMSIISSKGLANFFAALIGILSSFLGSRYYVFRHCRGSIARQASKFGVLYGSIAVFHGLILWVWSDIAGLNHKVGFLLATSFQVSISYFGNKYLVFKV